MISDTELKQKERKLYLAYFDDGIADIIAGLPVLMFGLGMVFDTSVFHMVSWLPILFYMPLKKRITLPRMGYVNFMPERQRKISRNMVVLIVAGTLSLLLGIVAFLGFEGWGFDLRDFMMEYGLLVFGAIMACAFALVSYLFELRRFIGYALLVFGGWFVPFLLSSEGGITVALSGGLTSLVGLWILFRFLANTPLPSE